MILKFYNKAYGQFYIKNQLQNNIYIYIILYYKKLYYELQELVKELYSYIKYIFFNVASARYHILWIKNNLHNVAIIKLDL